MDIEQMLAALRVDMAKLSDRPPLVMRYEKAAKMLDVSTSKLKSLIRTGELVPVLIGGRKMIPLSELERIATPRLPARIRAKAPPPKRNVRAEAAAGRAELRARR